MPSDRAFIVNLPLILTLNCRENWHRINSLKKLQLLKHLTMLQKLISSEIGIPSINLVSTFI